MPRAVRRIVPAVLAVLLAAAVLSWAWSRVPIPVAGAIGTALTTSAPSTLPPAPSLIIGTSAPTQPGAAPPVSATPSPVPGLPGTGGVLATPWPGADANGVMTWGPGEFTIAPPVYPPATVPTAAVTCPWTATDATWAQSAMTADASDDLETYTLLTEGRGYTIPGWGLSSERTDNIATYQQAEENWSQVATWINGVCFPPDRGPVAPITAAEAAQAVAWLQAGAASHSGPDAWSVAWRDVYGYVGSMFGELT